jgi:Na+/H+ antiporter NhaC
LGLPLAPFVAASLSGGIFGDHCSPISDTTIISSMAAATDHIDHVRTQLPYALVGGAVAAVAFALLGATM